MCVVAYVSGHGFGHSAREVEILRRLPPEIPLVVKTTAPEWFWREEIARPFEYVPDRYDAGCVQKDSISVHVAGTLAAWQEINAKNHTRRQSEADDLRQRGASVVVTDVAAFPLTVAAAVGIPSVCVANFTWADIYAGYVAEEPAFAPIVTALEAQYASATLCLDSDLSLPMPYFGHKKQVGLVARPFQKRCDELIHRLRPQGVGKRLALLYLGNWGLPIPYERLEAFTEWQFLSLSPPPVPVANWSIIGRDWMPHADLVASVDLVITKPGYGIVGECLHAGTPLLYCPRPNFAEYAALDHALQQWRGGLRLSMEQFLRVEWAEVLNHLPEWETIPALSAPGGKNAAEILLDFCT